MKLIKLTVILLMSVATSSAFAATGRYNDSYYQSASSQFYVGAGVGSLKSDVPSANNALAWSFFGGTTINRFLAAEIAYTNLGSSSLAGGEYLKGAAYSLNLVGNIPVTKSVSMFAKFGLANTGVYVESAGAAGTTYSLFAPTIGLGVQVGVGRNAEIRVAYDNYKFNATNVNPVTYNADITSVSVLFRF